MKTFLTIFLISIALNANAMIITSKRYGNTTAAQSYSVFFSGLPKPNLVHNRTFTYPEDDWENAAPITIDGFRYRDIITPPAEITLLEGGVGAPFVKINILTQPGQQLNTLFTFYKSPRTEPNHVHGYMEGEFGFESQ